MTVLPLPAGIDHVHALVRDSRTGRILAATHAGLFTPLGQGDVDILGVVQTLEAAGYRGWYVIEQDTAITEGLPPEGEGPIHQVTTSMRYLTDVVAPTLG